MNRATNPAIQGLRDAGILNALDVDFAGLIERLAGPNGAAVTVPAALLSALRRRGHVCMELNRAPAEWFAAAFGEEPPEGFDASKPWTLRAGQFPILGHPGEPAPLIVDAGRLFLHRFWTCRRDLADIVRSRAAIPPQPPSDAIRQALNETFPDPHHADQRHAAEAIASRRVVLITGGPGTGKTTAVIRAVRVLTEMEAAAPRVAFAAPTGKAVARIREAVRAANMNLDGATFSTLHRLLRIHPVTGRPAVDATHRLGVDRVIVDEASMVDLELMARLVRAVPPDVPLALIGDMDQLASVAPGSVFRDLCDGLTTRGGPAADAVVRLSRNFRFDESSGIGRLARAINRGDADTACAIATEGRPDVELRAPPDARGLGRALRARAAESWASLRDAASPSAALAALTEFRILAAHRVGPWGVERISADLAILRGGERGDGAPFMITANDPYADLYNGDTGVWWREGSDLSAVVETDGALRSLPAARLPPHEPAWALTVHKSQGSEYDHVLLVLPDRDSPLLTRELIYTAVTRARRRVEIWGDPRILAGAIARRTARMGSLAGALAEPEPRSSPPA
jgi:exodeoxyribonuclease V alpha subunit